MTIMEINKLKVLAIGLVLAGCSGLQPVAVADIADRSDVRNFIGYMVKQHKFDREELIDLFRHVITKKKIIDAIRRPAESKPWYKYRPIFVTKTRIKEGVEFWNKHAGILEKAHKEYGVPPEIVVSIIGVETRYGRYKGKYRIMDSLSTLAFNYPKRGKFFRGELVQYLLLTREEGLDPLTIKGSYAGAMGKPQFISSSYRHYAVDFDADGKRDLWENSADAIGSVANYFKKHKWRPGQPITGRAKVSGKAYKGIVKKGIKPHTRLSKLLKKGIKTKDKLPLSEPAALIQLKTKKGYEHWIGMDNFYVITRYNHSELYAMAVYQLSRAIVKQRKLSMAKAKGKAV